MLVVSLITAGTMQVSPPCCHVSICVRLLGAHQDNCQLTKLSLAQGEVWSEDEEDSSDEESDSQDEDDDSDADDSDSQLGSDVDDSSAEVPPRDCKRVMSVMRHVASCHHGGFAGLATYRHHPNAQTCVVPVNLAFCCCPQFERTVWVRVQGSSGSDEKEEKEKEGDSDSAASSQTNASEGHAAGVASGSAAAARGASGGLPSTSARGRKASKVRLHPLHHCSDEPEHA